MAEYFFFSIYLLIFIHYLFSFIVIFLYLFFNFLFSKPTFRNSEKFSQIDTSGHGIEEEKERKGSILLSYSAEDIANQVGHEEKKGRQT